MPAKKKLTKKKPAAKAAQPSSKKRPMSTKATPAAKKAAPKAKAKPMAKRKKPAAKKPARRPFHEGGMIDMELDMLETMAQAAMMEARNSNNPEELDRIFADLSVGIDQVRMVNERGRQPRSNPNVPQPQITPEQQQAARRMNQAQFMRPDLPPPPRMERPMKPEPPKRTPIRPMPSPMPDQPNIPRPILITPEEQARRDALNDYNQYLEQAKRDAFQNPAGATSRQVPSSPSGPVATPTRVPLNQPPMDRRPQPAKGSPQQNPNYKPSNDLRTRPPMDRRPQPTRPTVSPQQQQAMRAMNQARFTRPQVTPQMQAAARQMQQGTTPRPMNRGGMVARPRKPIHPDMPASFGQVQPNKPTGRR